MKRPVVRWAIQWRSRNRLDGARENFVWQEPTRPLLFCTRREARTFIAQEYSYIKARPDLRREPHGWLMPRPIQVRVILRRVS